MTPDEHGLTYWEGRVAQRLDGIDAALNRIEASMNEYRLKDENRLSTLELQMNGMTAWRGFIGKTLAGIWGAICLLASEAIRHFWSSK